MKKENDFEKILGKLTEQVDLIEKSYNPDHLNLHFDNLVRADPALFDALLSIGRDAWNVIQINRSWETSYWFYDFFQLVSRASVRILIDNTQKYISENVIVQLAFLLIEISQMTTTREYSGDITERNFEALANLFLAFSNLRKIVLTKAEEMNNQKVINLVQGAINAADKEEE